MDDVVLNSSSDTVLKSKDVEVLQQQQPVKIFKEHSLDRWFVLTFFLSSVTFLCELALLPRLAVIYYQNEQHVFFVLTVFFLVLSALVSTAFSMRWYINDEDDSSGNEKRPRLWKWIFRLFILALQLAPFLRYLDALTYGIRAYNARTHASHLRYQKLLRQMLDEEVNAAHLRLFVCFLQSAPQAVLHFTFLLKHEARLEDQCLAIVVCLISASWALTSYHRAVRASRDDKEIIGALSGMLMFSWHFFSIVARVTALALLAATLPSWLGALALVHFAMMALWLTMGNHTADCNNRCEEFIFHAALSFAYIFSFIAFHNGSTRYSYLAYYLICFIENTAALVVWCVAGPLSFEYNLLQFIGPTLQIFSFLLGLIFMAAYYKWHHPSGTHLIISKSISLKTSL